MKVELVQYNLYEEVNCKRSHVYDKFRRFTDPFYIKRVISPTGKDRSTNLRMAKPFGDNTYEMRIIDNVLLEDIKKHKHQDIIINRYIVLWSSLENEPRYFLKILISKPIFFDDDIIVFESLPNKGNGVISEDIINLKVSKVRRDLKLRELLDIE